MCKLSSKFISMLAEISDIKKNNAIKQFCSEAASIKAMMASKGLFDSGGTLALLADAAIKDFEKILDELFSIYKEIYEGNSNKIYTFLSVNKIVNIWDLKQKEFEIALSSSLTEELKVFRMELQKEHVLEEFKKSANSLGRIYGARIKAYLICIMKKSRQTNILILLLAQSIPVLIGVFAGYYLKFS